MKVHRYWLLDGILYLCSDLGKYCIIQLYHWIIRFFSSSSSLIYSDPYLNQMFIVSWYTMFDIWFFSTMLMWCLVFQFKPDWFTCLSRCPLFGPDLFYMYGWWGLWIWIVYVYVESIWSCFLSRVHVFLGSQVSLDKCRFISEEHFIRFGFAPVRLRGGELGLAASIFLAGSDWNSFGFAPWSISPRFEREG
jgi:hypothetical protein